MKKTAYHRGIKMSILKAFKYIIGTILGLFVGIGWANILGMI